VCISLCTTVVHNTAQNSSDNFSSGGGGHCLVQIEWRTARYSVCLPLLIFPCTIMSTNSLLTPAHPGGPGKRAVKRLWWWLSSNHYSSDDVYCRGEGKVMQVILLRRTLASSPKFECASCLQQWHAGSIISNYYF